VFGAAHQLVLAGYLAPKYLMRQFELIDGVVTRNAA
jgi:hypothetical protein